MSNRKGDKISEERVCFGVAAASLDSRIHKREEKELRRVFDYLTNFKQSHKVRAQQEQAMQLYKQKKGLLSAIQERENLSKAHGRTSQQPQLTASLLDQELKDIANDVSGAEAALKKIRDHANKKITKADLHEALKVTFKQSYTKKQIDDMVWEADESLDESLDWEELKYYFIRTIEDPTGLEPRNLFDVVQFMMFDINMDGVISVDDTMEILFHRYSRSSLDRYIKTLFGDELDLSFADYHKRVNANRSELLKKGANASFALD